MEDSDIDHQRSHRHRREAMVADQIEARGIANRDVLRVMREVPRHRFVPPVQSTAAYEDRPLPIGNGQTISQPYIVALMTELLEPTPDDLILDIGTGSGYLAAVVSRLANRIISVERIPHLADCARHRLQCEGYGNIEVVTADGTIGYAPHAPYNGIIISAAYQSIPPLLLEQLRPGGRLVMPVGADDEQRLHKVQKLADGTLQTTCHSPVRFVPLIGRYAWADA